MLNPQVVEIFGMMLASRGWVLAAIDAEATEWGPTITLVNIRIHRPRDPDGYVTVAAYLQKGDTLGNLANDIARTAESVGQRDRPLP